MSVNILRIEETDTTSTFILGPHFSTEWQADTLGEVLRVHTLRPGSRVVTVNAPSHLTPPHHGGVYCYALVGTGTTAPVAVANTYIVGGYTRIDPDIVTVCYHSLSSSKGQELPFGGMVARSSPEEPFEPLADYDAYNVVNWDGYDALPITAETLRAARSIFKSLPKTFGDPECSPGADGSIVFEWLKDYGPFRKLFIDIGPGRTWKAYWRLANGKIGTVPRKHITISTIPELRKLFETLLRG